jgi:hypothetical protein
MNHFIDIQKELFASFEESYMNLNNNINNIKFEDNNFKDNIISKISIINSKITKLKFEIDDILLLLLNNKVELSDIDTHLIESNEYQNKIIKQFLPAMLAYSIILDK